MPRILISLLSSSIHRRICPVLYFVGAACRTIVCAAGLDFFGGVAPVAEFVTLLLVGCGGGGGGCRLAGTGVAFGPVVGCFPLSFLVGGGGSGSSGVGVAEVAGGGVACVAASAYERVGVLSVWVIAAVV